MNGYVTDARLNRAVNLPIAFPQTELKAGRSLFVCAFTLTHGQRLELRSLTLHAIRVLTNGVVPELSYTSDKMCSVGLYRNSSDCTPLASASVEGAGVAAINCFNRVVVETPGTYSVVVKNNAANVDISVSATGAAKMYF